MNPIVHHVSTPSRRRTAALLALGLALPACANPAGGPEDLMFAEDGTAPMPESGAGVADFDHLRPEPEWGPAPGVSLDEAAAPAPPTLVPHLRPDPEALFPVFPIPEEDGTGSSPGAPSAPEPGTPPVDDGGGTAPDPDPGPGDPAVDPLRVYWFPDGTAARPSLDAADVVYVGMEIVEGACVFGDPGRDRERIRELVDATSAAIHVGIDPFSSGLGLYRPLDESEARSMADGCIGLLSGLPIVGIEIVLPQVVLDAPAADLYDAEGAAIRDLLWAFAGELSDGLELSMSVPAGFDPSLVLDDAAEDLLDHLQIGRSE